MVTFGTLIAYWLDFGLSYVDSSVQWRFPIAFQILFALTLFIGVGQLPESPRWLIAHDQKDKAREVLAALDNIEKNDDYITAEVTIISDAINRFSRSQLGFKELFSGGKQQNFARMTIGASTQFFQQFTGCNASIYYSTVFQKSIGLTGKLPLILGGIFSTVYALFTLPSFFFN